MDSTLLMLLMFGGRGTGGGVAPLAPSAPIDLTLAVVAIANYEPSWISEFTLPPQDSNGDSVLTPSATSRILYVSSAGNDGTAVTYNSTSFADPYAPTSEMAFLTREAAELQMRDGFDDYLLCKSGDTFTFNAYLQPSHGLSAASRKVYGSYGGTAPFILNNVGTTVAYRLWQNLSNYIAIVNCDFQWTSRDPNHVDFVGWGSMNFEAAAIEMTCTSTGGLNDPLVEGCKIQHYGAGVVTTNTDIPLMYSGIIIRKNVIANSYTGSLSSRPQGLGLAGTSSYLIEENHLISNGFYDAVGTTSPADEFSHSMYAISIHSSIIRNNISYNPSSIHFKYTADMAFFKLGVALTGAAETQVVANVVQSAAMPSTGTLSIPTDGAATVVVNYTSKTDTVFTIPATDFSSDNASTDKFVSYTGTNYIKSYDIAQYGNLFIDGEIASSMGGNIDNGDTAPRFSGLTYQNNVAIDIGKSQNTGRTLGWGADPQDNINTVVSDNYFLPVDNVSINNQYPVKVIGYSSGVDVYNNISYQMGSYTLLNGDSYSNAETLVLADYVDATRTIPSYMTSIGETATNEALAAELLNMSSIDDPLYQVDAINDYLKAGFTLVGIKLLSNVVSVTKEAGETVLLSLDVIGVGTITYQWYNGANDAILVGETARTLTYSMTAGDDGKQYYCIADDSLSGSITSATATVTFDAGIPSRSIPRLGGTNGVYDLLSMSAQVLVFPEAGFKFKFRLVSLSGVNQVNVVAAGVAGDGEVSMGFFLDTNEVSIARQNNISVPSIGTVLLDGNVHEIIYHKALVGVVSSMTIDGNTYTSATTNTDATAHRVQAIAPRNFGSTSLFDIFDFDFIDSSGTPTLGWTLDSGAGTEAASTGTSLMTITLTTGGWITYP